MLTYLGRKSFGQHSPLCLKMNTQLGQAIGMALTELTAQLGGLTRISAALTVKPPGFDATLAGMTQVLANIRLTGPVISLQADAVLGIMAGLRLQIKALAAMISLPLGGSIHAYWYEGSASAFGGELSASTAGGFPGGAPTDHVGALILAGVEPATVLILKSIFKTEL